VAADFFTVPTATFQVLFVCLFLAHHRRRILHLNVTANPRWATAPACGSLAVPPRRTSTPATIPDGGHQWPDGNPPAIPGLPGCPFGYQSETFSANEALWTFFSQHPPR
jgi:hypothetical protein